MFMEYFIKVTVKLVDEGWRGQFRSTWGVETDSNEQGVLVGAGDKVSEVRLFWVYFCDFLSMD